MVEHLLFASIVWAAAWLLTSMPRGSATIKYWIWVATSLNFLLPLSLVPQRFWPAQIAWFTPLGVFERIGNGLTFNASLSAAWSIGSALMIARLWLRIRSNRRTGQRGPAVVGLIRPRISLPERIDQVLTRAELDAVLIHESRHATRRDNLIGLVYEMSLCALWFHPLVWISGSRLGLYRELSCDESVARRDLSGELLSALTKLAAPERPCLLQARASSFVSDRVARLGTPQQSQRLANAILLAVFAAVLVSAAIGPPAQTVAGYFCALTRGR